jgi:DNA-3-methyladenine glycosylase
MTAKILDNSFFLRDVLDVAPELIGKIIARKFEDGVVKRYRITETEAYRGEEDLACHACKGRTARTEVMYSEGGIVYVYLIYGMYWMLNFVTGEKGNPSAVLIRGVEGFNGPGKVGKELQLNKTFYGEDLAPTSRIWIEDDGAVRNFEPSIRIGVDYAGPVWATKPWRYVAEKLTTNSTQTP